MKKLLDKKGQFSIIAALLVAIVLVAAIITTYSIIRNNPLEERPQVLGSIDEMNLAINHILEFVIGYYGSILQVTGNTTYAKSLATNYLQSGLENIAYTHPSWSPSFKLNDFQVSASWFNRTSYTQGAINVTYSIVGLGISGIQYAASAGLKVTVNPSSTSSVLVNVTRDGNKPCPNLSKNNFFFYNYSYTESAWRLNNTGVKINSISSTDTYSVYNITILSGLDPTAYMVQVADYRGITVSASTFSRYTYTFTWNQTLYSSLSRDTIVVEALQNGTLRWLGQNLLTYGKPIPPIPVKALHVNQTIDGVNREAPFQVEDWGSNYRVPLGLTSNASIFSSRNMLAFLVNHRVQKVTFWWDGRDTATQTSYAWKNRYFTGDDPANRILTNGILSLTIDNFRITSRVGTSTSTAEFLRINDRKPTYGAAPAYVIHHGIVRDIVQQEAEWSGGIANCPNVYSQIFLTLPANATYYTYASRLIFMSSSQSRTITDLSAIQLSSDWMTGLRSLTENGTSSGFPIIGETFAGQTLLFYNFSSPSTGWKHHWSEYISGSTGAGIMFTDSSNLKLYAFDSIAGAKTGALSVTTAQRTVWKTPTAVYDKCGEDGSYPASNAIDEPTDSTPDTYWRHSTTENHWIILDMGKTVPISRIRIYQSSTSDYRWGRSSGIEVYVSNDTISWRSVWNGTLNSGGWQQSAAFSAQGRYVKLVSRSTSSLQRLYEVQVETQERQTTIEFNPVKRYQASFTYPLDVTWRGAVVTFDSGNPQDTIYPSSGGNIGLWVMVEHPPIVAVN